MAGIRIDEVHGVRVATVTGSCSADEIANLASCDIVYAADDAVFGAMDASAARRAGIVTRCIAAGELEQESAKLLAELGAKDELALRFTRDTLQQVRGIAWDDILAFNAAKQAELKALQAGRPSARAAMVESFLAGKSKPGLGR